MRGCMCRLLLHEQDGIYKLDWHRRVSINRQKFDRPRVRFRSESTRKSLLSFCVRVSCRSEFHLNANSCVLVDAFALYRALRLPQLSPRFSLFRAFRVARKSATLNAKSIGDARRVTGTVSRVFVVFHALSALVTKVLGIIKTFLLFYLYITLETTLSVAASSYVDAHAESSARRTL